MITMSDDNDHLKIIASIIEYRIINMLRTQKLMEDDIKALYITKSKRSQNRICENIYTKMEYMEILLSKIIDDVMSVEIIEMDKLMPRLPLSSCSCDKCGEHDENHSYQ